MTDATPVSVIIVSHGRPALLRRAVQGVLQLFYRPVELVIVADEAGLVAISDMAEAKWFKTAVQEAPNISAARNLGADLAAGEILAFIDDDAVPEPTWATRLTAPFADPQVMAATGTVLGRNGISVQWGKRSVDARGDAHPARGALPADHAVKLEGTNMALRRSALRDLGGFDRGFSFYMDETDLAYRLHRAGLKAVFTPDAVVHHGYAESLRRSADRVPRSLFQIGASTAIYLRKHASEALEAGLSDLLAAQSNRLQAFVRSRAMQTADMRRLLEDLQAGVAAGRAADLAPPHALAPEPPGFCAVTEHPAPEPVVISGRWFQRKALMQEAEAAAAQGHSTSLFLLAPTIRAHRVAFSHSGVWVQSGGLFGPSERSQPRFRWWRFAARIDAEIRRLETIRWI